MPAPDRNGSQFAAWRHASDAIRGQPLGRGDPVAVPPRGRGPGAGARHTARRRHRFGRGPTSSSATPRAAGTRSTCSCWARSACTWSSSSTTRASCGATTTSGTARASAPRTPRSSWPVARRSTSPAGSRTSCARGQRSSGRVSPTSATSSRSSRSRCSCTTNGLRCELPPASARGLYGLDGNEHVSNLPGISELLLEPARRRAIGPNEERILERADGPDRPGPAPRARGRLVGHRGAGPRRGRGLAGLAGLPPGRPAGAGADPLPGRRRPGRAADERAQVQQGRRARVPGDVPPAARRPAVPPRHGRLRPRRRAGLRLRRVVAAPGPVAGRTNRTGCRW